MWKGRETVKGKGDSERDKTERREKRQRNKKGDLEKGGRQEI